MTPFNAMRLAKSTGGGGGTDPYFANVSLLITGIGVDEATNITDSSSNAHTITVISGTKYEGTGGNLPPGQSTYVYINGSSGLTIPDHGSLDMGSGDFTIETYYRMDNFGTFPVLFNKVASGLFSPYLVHFSQAAQTINLYSSNNGTTNEVSINTGNFAFSLGVWYHLAFTRSGDTFTGWLDGTSIGTDTLSGSVQDTSAILTIGRDEPNTLPFAGGVAGFRITKSVARYTGTFTPPSLPLPTS